MPNWSEINLDILECCSRERDSRLVDCLNGLLRKYGDDGMIYLALGDAYAHMGANTLAIEHYKKAESLFPLERFKKLARARIRGLERYIL